MNSIENQVSRLLTNQKKGYWSNGYTILNTIIYKRLRDLRLICYIAFVGLQKKRYSFFGKQKSSCSLYSEWDLNPHEHWAHRILSPVRLPVPPSEQEYKNNKIILNKKGVKQPDASLRDYENIPLKKGKTESSEQDIQEYMEKEVLPHFPDTYVDYSKTKVGYEINFTKYFYEYKPLRSLSDIRADILALEKETDGLLNEVIN